MIELKAVAKSYGSVTALRTVDLSVGAGISGLLGPNGAGKTTLLRILATVLAPDTGSVHIGGWATSRPAERSEIRRRLGYMPQEPGFYRNFTVFEFVDYVAILKLITERRERHQEVRRVISLVDLTGVAHQKIRGLSGGMRRRLAFAQALLGQPDVLLLDEPMAGLDPEQRLRFREVISKLEPRPTIILSTHQTEDVAALCDRVIVLVAGGVKFDSTPESLASTARDRVWTSTEPEEAVISWRTGEGLFRHIGDPPPESALVEPTIDDAYLLMAGRGAVVPA